MLEYSTDTLLYLDCAIYTSSCCDTSLGTWLSPHNNRGGESQHVRTCSCVRLPWSSLALSPIRPKRILMRWASLLVCRNTRQCSWNVRQHRAGWRDW